jgi:Ni/Fe-hydrogenase subunit HybB-like protein
VFFFLSAIAVGLAMTIFESSMSSKHFGQQLELPILRELGRVLFVVLAIYAILRFEDLLHRGALRLTVRPSYEMGLFWVEVLLAIIVPLGLLLFRRIRTSPAGLYAAAVMVALGFVTNRLNVSITGLEQTAGTHYMPKWTEIAVTGAITALGFALFGLAVKYLPIFQHAPVAEEPRTIPAKVPELVHAGD